MNIKQKNSNNKEKTFIFIKNLEIENNNIVQKSIELNKNIYLNKKTNHLFRNKILFRLINFIHLFFKLFYIKFIPICKPNYSTLLLTEPFSEETNQLLTESLSEVSIQLLNESFSEETTITLSKSIPEVITESLSESIPEGANHIINKSL